MPDPVAPAPGTPAAAPAAPVDRLQPTVGLAGVIAGALAKARATAAAAPPPAAPARDPLSAPAAPATPAVVPPPAAKPEIDADPAAVKRWAALSRENRELQAKIKTLEPAAAEAATMASARKLYSEGKRIEAVALLAGATDATAEMESLMADYIKGGTTAEEITAAQLAKRLDDEKAAQKVADDAKAAKDAEAKIAAENEMLLKDARESMSKVLDDPAMATKYERCARPANREEAAAAVVGLITAERAKRKLTAEQLTPELTRVLIDAAFSSVEEEYDRVLAETTARYSKGALQTPAAGVGSETSQRADASVWGRRQEPEPGKQPAAPTIDASLSRPGVTPQPPRSFYSHAEAAARAREAARRG